MGLPCESETRSRVKARHELAAPKRDARPFEGARPAKAGQTDCGAITRRFM